MKLGTLQKASLAVLLWLFLFFWAADVIYEIVWRSHRGLAALRAGRYAIDAPNLPLAATVSIFALPTIVVGALVLLYRRGVRQRRLSALK
jgi:hypothetical protein